MTSREIDKYAVWARANLGMSRTEFDRLLPREFIGLSREWVKAQRLIDERIARIQYTIAVSNGATQPDGSPLTLAYFIPGLKKKRTRRYSSRELFKQFCAAAGQTPTNGQ